MSNIRQTGGVTPQLAQINPAPVLQAEMATGAALAQAKLQENLRTISEARSGVEAMRQKQKAKQLTDSAVGYIQKLATNEDPATKSIMSMVNINTDDANEVKEFVKLMGGGSEAVSSLQKSIGEVRKLQLENQGKAPVRQKQIYTEQGIQNLQDENKSGTFTPLVGPGGNTVYEASSINVSSATDQDTLTTQAELDSLLKDKTTKVTYEKAGVDDEGNALYAVKVTTLKEEPKGEEQTIYQKKYEEELAGKLVKWDEGERMIAETNLAAYDKVIGDLLSGVVNTRTISEFLPDFGDIKKSYRAAFQPKGQEAFDTIAAITYQSLKATLGAQFAQKEGERLLEAAYNPQLSPEANVERLSRARNQLQQIINAKNRMSKHFKEGGTLANFNMPTAEQVTTSLVTDFVNEMAAEDGKGGGASPNGTIDYTKIGIKVRA